ncbi:MAG: histidine phosphatase family protein [Chloroflexota bacterium]
MRLYLIRHADPDYENDTITPAGRLEAEPLAERMASHGLDELYCSPLGRARATAQPIADRLGLTPTIAEWTSELSGLRVTHDPWGELVAWDIPGEIIRGHDQYPGPDNWHALPALSALDLRAAFDRICSDSDAFLAAQGYVREGRRYRCVAPHRRRVAVVCHNGFGLTWLAHLLDLPVTLVWSGFWLAPSSVTTILFDERSAEWATPRCLGVGDVSHLYKAGLPVQPAGLKANVD